VDGFEVLARFRRTPEGLRTPVIVWTGKDLTAADRRRLEGLAQGVAAKGLGAAEALVRELGSWSAPEAGR
jgi:CheY-like chemotaxis protein